MDREVPVACVALDLKYGRDSPTVLRGEPARVELHPVDHVDVEDGENAPEMERGEDRHPVEQDQVLILRPSPHVEGCGEVGRRHHTR